MSLSRPLLVALLALLAIPNARGANILLVIGASTPEPAEADRITTFESWGHTVTTIQDSEPQANYDAAVIGIDVIYVPESIFSGDLSSKVRQVTASVVSEELGNNDDFGFSTVNGVGGTASSITITDNTHPITAGFPLGSLTISTSSTSRLNRLVPTQALGLQSLADDANVPGDPSVFFLEAGVTLANATDGNTLSLGRRVGLPMDQDFDWNNLNANGLLLVERAIDWAAVGNLDYIGGQWRFDETSGTTLLDTSGSEADGTLVGATRIADGVVNGAVAFAGNGSDRISLPHTVLDGADDVTFATWFRATSNTSNPTLISAANASNDNDFMVRILGSNQIAVYNGEGPTSRVIWTLGFSVTDDEWRHLAVVRDSVNGEITLYLNGVEQGTQIATLNPIEVDPGGLLLGIDQDTVGGSFETSESLNGALDEVSLYRRTLTEAEIVALATAPGLLGHWKFDETSGTTAPDSSPRGNDLTASSTPTWVTDGVRRGAVDLTGVTFSGPADLDEAFDNGSGSAVGLAGWIRLNTTVSGMSASTAEIIDMQRSSQNTGFDLSFRRTEQQLRFRVYDGNGPTNLTADVSTLHAGEWLHFAAAYDGAEMRLYLNGELAATVPNTAGLDIGDITMMLGDDLNGALDDFVLYDRAMTNEEIAKHYGRIGHWRLNETTGVTAADSSLLANDGTYANGVTLNQPGPYPGEGAIAASLDGTNDQIQVPHHDAYNPDEAVSIALWVRRGDVAWWDTLVSKGKLGNPPYILAWTDDGRLTFKSNITNVVSSGVVPEGVWAHIAVTFDEQEVRFYVNGQLDSTHTMVTELTTDSTLELNIGSAEFDTGYAEGDLFDVRLYNRVLSQDELAELYGLIGHWRLDETAGTTATDSSPFANDATHVNGPTPGVEGPYPGVLATEYDPSGVQDRTIGPNIPPYDNLSDQISVAFWTRLRVDSGAPAQQFPIANADFGSQLGYSAIYTQSSDQMTFRLHSGSGFHDTVWPNTGIEEDEWVHVAGVYDGAEVKLYANGQLVSTTAYTGGIAPRVGADLLIGFDHSGGLHDVRLYNRAISHEEIARIYGLVGHWKLDEASGSVALDSSGLGNDGTYQGGALPGAIGPTLDAPTLAAEFNGVAGDRVTLPNMNFDFSRGLSMAVWYRADALHTTNGPFTDFFSLSNGVLEDDVSLGFNNTQGLDLFLSDTADGTGFRVLLENSPPVLGIWRHAVATVDASGAATLYHDGVEVATGFVSLPRNLLRTNNGIGETPYVYTFDGRLHDARIYNRPINVDEVRTLFFSQSVPGPRIIRWVEAANP